MSKMEFSKAINRLKAIVFRTSVVKFCNDAYRPSKLDFRTHRETAFIKTRRHSKRTHRTVRFFVVGSDRWNPLFRNGFDVDFVVAPPYKRIAYARAWNFRNPTEYEKTYRE